MKVIYSKRKTVALELRRDEDGSPQLLVRAPYRTSREVLQKFVDQRRAWIEEKTARMLATAPPEEPTPQEAAKLRCLAEQLLPRLTADWADRLNLHPVSIKITSAKKRFGSCSAHNRLCFSWRLLRYPPAAVEYVVVHELAHIAHKNHQKEFYDLIQSHLTDHKNRRKLLTAPPMPAAEAIQLYERGIRI